MSWNRDAHYVVGADLGGTNIRAAVLDRAGKMLGHGKRPSLAQEGSARTVGQIKQAVEEAISESGVALSEIGGMGIGVPGHIDPAGKKVLWAPNFYEDSFPYRNISLADPIAEATGLPVLMGNDANVAAMGEFRFGAGRGTRTMVMFTLGTGVGGGLILDGKLWTGFTGGAGELGHIIIAAGERGGAAAYGSLESMAQISAICERASRKLCQGRKSVLADVSGYDWHRITPKDIADAAKAGDAVALEVLEETGYYIGLGVTSVVMLLNPEKIVIGGGVAGAGDLLFEPIRRTAFANSSSTLIKNCQIIPAELGDDAGIYGGAGLVFDALESAV
ncbi:ROK family protein [Armatimonas sp.]|uniref:ROK family protein n=1 Tax=Armatimonas sp. TaxID=1872638 RepID=UPI00286A5202|nr:ROK family protein [Armatimonas sp.]